jgi:quercetin dioxygenase-like cupin family protein
MRGEHRAYPLYHGETRVSDFPPIRRIVTGHNDAGVAQILIDGPATNVRNGATGTRSTLMWCTDEMPADIAIGEAPEDYGNRILGTPPPPHGTRFTINDLPPGSVSPHHRTESIDYAIVLAGDIEMIMDEGRTRLAPGDVVIQRGTNHTWANVGTTPGRIAFILIDAKPLGIGHAVGHGQAASQAEKR